MSLPTLNKPDAANPAMTLQQHTERQWRGVAGPDRSAGAGVKNVIAVDFRNGMIDGVLNQQC
jgi:hypothetical protein